MGMGRRVSGSCLRLGQVVWVMLRRGVSSQRELGAQGRCGRPHTVSWKRRGRVGASGTLKHPGPWGRMFGNGGGPQLSLAAREFLCQGNSTGGEGGLWATEWLP